MRFRYDITVNNSADKVWDFVMQFERRPEWIDFVDETEINDKKEGWVGTKYREKSVFLGIPLNVTFEVTEYTHKKSWTSICKMPPFYPEIFVRMHDEVNGSVSGYIEFEIKIGILGLLPKRIIRKQVDKLVRPIMENFERIANSL